MLIENGLIKFRPIQRHSISNFKQNQSPESVPNRFRPVPNRVFRGFSQPQVVFSQPELGFSQPEVDSSQLFSIPASPESVPNRFRPVPNLSRICPESGLGVPNRDCESRICPESVPNRGWESRIGTVSPESVPTRFQPAFPRFQPVPNLSRIGAGSPESGL